MGRGRKRARRGGGGGGGGGGRKGGRRREGARGGEGPSPYDVEAHFLAHPAPGVRDKRAGRALSPKAARLYGLPEEAYRAAGREIPVGLRGGFAGPSGSSELTSQSEMSVAMRAGGGEAVDSRGGAASFFAEERRAKTGRGAENGGALERGMELPSPRPAPAQRRRDSGGEARAAPLRLGGLGRPGTRERGQPFAGGRDKQSRGNAAPKPPVVVDLLSSGSEDDGPQGEQAGTAALKVPTAVVLERVRETGGAGPAAAGGARSQRERCMVATGSGVRFGTLEVGAASLEANSEGLRVTFPLADVPGLVGLPGRAALTVDWGAVNDFWISGKHSEPGQHLVVFGFPHLLPSLRPHLDPGGLDHAKRYVVFRISEPGGQASQEDPVVWSLHLVRMVQTFLLPLPGGERRNCIMTPGLAAFFRGGDCAACPPELESQESGRRRSIRLNNALRSGKGGGISDPFVYPRVGDPQAVMVYPEDLFRLRGPEYLNDTIIDFYLQYLRNEAYPVRAQNVHIFNSFFYRKLAQRRKREAPRAEGVSFGQALHQRVSKWTQDVDIFTKDFLFIPINKSEHWILAVVCHPRGAFGAEAGAEPEAALGEGGRGGPCILIFDSLGGCHNHSAKLIGDYLTWEWRSKPRGASEVAEGVEKFKAPVLHPSVPRQTNTSDCGLFVLHYAEKFLSEGPEQVSPIKKPSDAEPEQIWGRRSKRGKPLPPLRLRGTETVWQQVRQRVGHLIPSSDSPREEPATPVEQGSRGKVPLKKWPYVFVPRWFSPSEASAKRQSILTLIRTIGPKLKVDSGSLGTDRLAQELSAAGAS